MPVQVRLGAPKNKFMAKRKRKSSKNFKLKHPREVGKFYRISDSKNGHPGRVFYSDPGEDVYFVIKFTA